MLGFCLITTKTDILLSLRTINIYSVSKTRTHLDDHRFFSEKVEHMVSFYEQKACLFWCCANGLPLTPFTLLFPSNTSAHTHTCPRHFTPAPCSIMNIFMSGRVLREIPCIKLNTFPSSVFQTDKQSHAHTRQLEEDVERCHKLGC